MVYVNKTYSIIPDIKLKTNVQPTPLIFIHMPKTGGTTINYLTITLLKKNGRKYEALYSACKGRKAWAMSALNCLGGIEKLKLKPDAYKLTGKNIDFITGHMPIPNNDYFATDVNYFAVIRNPAERLISLGNNLFQDKFLRESQLKDYLLNLEVDNLQTRWLAGENYMQGTCNEDTYAKAIKNIHERFLYVAPIDDEDTLIGLVIKYLGFSYIAYQRINVSKNKILKGDDEEFNKQILDKNSYDMRIYEYVKNSWQEWKLNNIDYINTAIDSNKNYTLVSPAEVGFLYRNDDRHFQQVNLQGEVMNSEEGFINLSW